MTTRSAADLIALVKAREILASGPVSSERKALLKENLNMFRRAIEALEAEANEEDSDLNGSSSTSRPELSAVKGSNDFLKKWSIE